MERKRIKITYIGGGSRGWAWALMKDLALSPNLCGEVSLYDIDYNAALDNEIIGNNICRDHANAAKWVYKAERDIETALFGADFVVISIMPGTFKEMYSDVHAPEKYGIFQPVGDTIGPGGVIRALRTIPMYEFITLKIKECCPKAWVINYTNPMAVCTKTMYDVFPEIKAFGCCHEVFGTQSVLVNALREIAGIEGVKRQDIKVNVTGVNHFTWITEATYKGMDLFPIYREYAEKHMIDKIEVQGDVNWMNRQFESLEKVKFDLFLKYGYIAAAGDRHLAEFCPPQWYTSSVDAIHDMGFALTTVDWRLLDLDKRLKLSEGYRNGEKLELVESGEEGVLQMSAILGVGDLITNVNLPNRGQIPNLPNGTVVETNAAFTSDSVKPVMTDPLPYSLFGLIAPIVAVQNLSVKAGLERNLDIAFEAFLADPHVQSLKFSEARALFNEMIDNTKEYLTDYLK